jgi:CspA family cold shock protein
MRAHPFDIGVLSAHTTAIRNFTLPCKTGRRPASIKTSSNSDNEPTRWSRGAKTHSALFWETHMATGTIKFFNHSRGFGFIEPEDGSKDVFVHVTAMEQAGIPSLDEGDKVEYEVKHDERSGKSSASDLKKL